MILLVTNKRDLTTDFVVAELRQRGLAFARLNTEDIAEGDVELAIGGGWNLNVEGERVELDKVTAAYFRRPEAPRPRPGVAAAEHARYCVDEWSAVMRSLWNLLEGRWLNSPFAILRAEDKPRQLTVARDVGLPVPDTVVTNRLDAVRGVRGPLIAKPLRHALVEDGGTGKVIFTNRIKDLDDLDEVALGVAPAIFQSHVEKVADVRATVVGDRVFAVSIDSQSSGETRTDWRRGSNPDLTHQVLRLPQKVEAGCVEVVRRLGLNFAAIDLVHGLDGLFWFLEANPNGQWAWIQKRTGLNIAGAIVDALVAR